MGYNTAFLMIEGVSAAGAMDLFDSRFDDADMFASPGQVVSFDVAAAGSLHPNLALGAVGNWAVFWDPSGRLSVLGFPMAVSKGRRALSYLLQDCDSRYGFEYFVDGILQRSITHQGDLIWEESGAVLLEEAGLGDPIGGLGESFVFGLMERLTRISQSDLAGAAYQMLEFLG